MLRPIRLKPQNMFISYLMNTLSSNEKKYLNFGSFDLQFNEVKWLNLERVNQSQQDSPFGVINEAFLSLYFIMRAQNVSRD